MPLYRAGGGGQILTPSRFYVADDLFNPASGHPVIPPSNAGTGAQTTGQATDAANRTGVWRSSTGTTATGRASCWTPSVQSICLGQGAVEFVVHINIAILSTSAEGYWLMLGFSQSFTALTPTDACAFVYDERGTGAGGASANWQCLTANNNARTFQVTGTPVTAAAWHELRIVINAAGTSAEFYVDDVLVHTATLNIPNGGPTRAVGFGWTMVKTVGLTARTMDADFISVDQQLTTPR